MKKAFQNIFCVLTICAMVGFVGCGDKKDGDGKANDETKTSETTGADSGGGSGDK